MGKLMFYQVTAFTKSFFQECSCRGSKTMCGSNIFTSLSLSLYRSIAINEHNIEDYKNTAGKRKVRIKNLEDSTMKGWGDTIKLTKSLFKPLKVRKALSIFYLVPLPFSLLNRFLLHEPKKL